MIFTKLNHHWLINILKHILFWYLVWLFYTYFFSFNTNNLSYVNWFSSILILVTCFVTYTNIYYLLPKYLNDNKLRLFILYNLYVLVGAAYSIIILIYVGFIFRSDFQLKFIPPLSASLPFILFSVYLIVFIVLTFKFQRMSYKTLKHNKILENQALQNELRLKEEALKVLKMQIHPHFLFNTLNTIYGLTLKKDEYAPHLILKLSELLDYILYQIDKPFVNLKDEINHIENYIELEQFRFRDSLRIETFFNDLEPLKISPMLLIPFVENSFKHGVIINGYLRIKIQAIYKNHCLIFTVVNTCGKESDSGGIGLDNIKKRLALLYPNKHQLIITHKEEYFKVELILEIDERKY